VPEHPELQDEQEFLDRAYDGLEFMRGEARQMLDGVLDLGRGGTFQSRTERDIVVRTSLARLEQLDVGDQALYFGRIDRLPEPGLDGHAEGAHHGDGDPAGRTVLGESFHIGRLAVSGPDHEPLVVDWRAPVAEPFYRATGLDPQGLARRRHLAVRGRTVLGLEDEYFVDPDGRPTAPAPGPDGAAAHDGNAGGERLLSEGLVLGGPGALLSALGQARTGHMGDIVATIQREQDEIIRSPLPGVLVVQGGPGTGKTAVALHRAAYLLYTHRFPLERQGVLVVGPNPLFLRYIEQVLPSLGETGVSLSTVAGLVPEVRVRGVDNAAVAKLKGDVRMVKVLARAVRTRQRALRRDAEVPFGATVLRLRAGATEDIVAMARRRPGTHNARRRFVESQVLRALADDYRARAGRGAGATGPEAEAPSQEEQDELVGRLRRTPEVVEALDRMWPRLSPHEFVHDLLGARPLLAAAGQGILNTEEVRRLHRPRSAALDSVPWTVGDAALVDEARTLLGPRRGPRSGRARSRPMEEGTPGEGGFWPAGLSAAPIAPSSAALAGEEEIRSFGHIVVDEVQDLSPMQLRMLARRSLSGSMTVVGDIAQATGPWAPADWDDVTRHLSPQRPPKLVELTVSYRTPAEVVSLAAKVLSVAAPAIAPPRPVRQVGHAPRLVSSSRAGLADALVSVAREEVAAVTPGRVAVLGPAVMVPELARALEDAGLDPVDPRDPAGAGLAAGLVVLPADETNGLEFDSVIVVEPSLVAAVGDDSPGEGPPVATTRGLRTLYVAFTRPTRRLTLLHAEALPAGLR
jgi:DNA helicase IV